MIVKHKRGVTTPPTNLLTHGEIAINYNGGEEGLYVKNNLNEIVKFPSVNGVKTMINEISLIYSTSEQIIGEWIDGRPIYSISIEEKDIDLGDPIDSDNLVTVDPETGKEINPFSKKWCYIDLPSNINVDFYIKIEGFAECYSEKATTTPLFQPIPRVCPDACIDYSIGFGDLRTNRIGILFGGKYTQANVFLNIMYIKK